MIGKRKAEKSQSTNPDSVMLNAPSGFNLILNYCSPSLFVTADAKQQPILRSKYAGIKKIFDRFEFSELHNTFRQKYVR